MSTIQITYSKKETYPIEPDNLAAALMIGLRLMSPISPVQIVEKLRMTVDNVADRA